MPQVPDQAGLFGDDADVKRTEAGSRALTLPFGKFKGEPVDLLLANSEYAIWLLSSKAAMLRRSHPHLYHWLISHFGAPDTTPEHNRLQNRFLDEDFCLQLYLHLNPGLAERPRLYATAATFLDGWKRILASRVSWAHSCGMDSAGYRADASQESRAAKVREAALEVLQEDTDKVILSCSQRPERDDAGDATDGQRSGRLNQWSPVLFTYNVKFEVDGADVDFQAGGSLGLFVDEQRSGYGHQLLADLVSWSDRKHFRVEVKPFVGDDYPVILRSMTTKKCNVLLVEVFEADGASWEQVKKVFASRGIQVALLEDVLLTPIPDYARALPLPSIDKVEMMRLATLAYDEHVAKVDAARARVREKFGGDF